MLSMGDTSFRIIAAVALSPRGAMAWLHVKLQMKSVCAMRIAYS
jgi:hypothetical protein